MHCFIEKIPKVKLVPDSLIHFQPALKKHGKKKKNHKPHSLRLPQLYPEKAKLKSEFRFALPSKIPRTHSYQVLLHFIPRDSTKTS